MKNYGLVCKTGLVCGPFNLSDAVKWQVYSNEKYGECRPHKIILWKDRKGVKEKQKKS